MSHFVSVAVHFDVRWRIGNSKRLIGCLHLSHGLSALPCESWVSFVRIRNVQLKLWTLVASLRVMASLARLFLGRKPSRQNNCWATFPYEAGSVFHLIQVRIFFALEMFFSATSFSHFCCQLWKWCVLLLRSQQFIHFGCWYGIEHAQHWDKERSAVGEEKRFELLNCRQLPTVCASEHISSTLKYLLNYAWNKTPCLGF